jgi:hypothetical protein
VCALVGVGAFVVVFGWLVGWFGCWLVVLPALVLKARGEMMLCMPELL